MHEAGNIEAFSVLELPFVDEEFNKRMKRLHAIGAHTETHSLLLKRIEKAKLHARGKKSAEEEEEGCIVWPKIVRYSAR